MRLWRCSEIMTNSITNIVAYTLELNLYLHKEHSDCQWLTQYVSRRDRSTISAHITIILMSHSTSPERIVAQADLRLLLSNLLFVTSASFVLPLRSAVAGSFNVISGSLVLTLLSVYASIGISESLVGVLLLKLVFLLSGLLFRISFLYHHFTFRCDLVMQNNRTRSTSQFLSLPPHERMADSL